VKKLFIQDNQLIINTNFLVPHEGYVTTKYHRKAVKENKLVQFLQAKLVL